MKFRWLFLPLIFILLLACSTTPRFTSHNSSPVSTSGTKSNQLRQAAERWMGVPYRLGGNDRKGIDCSGLAVQLYREVFGIRLPRNSAEQRTLGYAVHPPYLKPGDLLFFRFKTDEGIEHVGIYLGSHQFVHASQTRGVVIDNLNSPYYQRHLVVIRRVLH